MSKMLLAAAAAASLLLAGAAAMAQSGSVQVTHAWARATPAKAENGAAYLTIEAATPDRLTGVSTPVANNAELHQMTMQGDVMRMRQVAGIDLPAGKPVTLKPGAFHIMLLGLKQPLKQGGHFPLTLVFAKAGTRQVEVTVEGVGAMGPNNQSGGGGMPMSVPMQH
jgi:periplasmic copper chaperone A